MAWPDITPEDVKRIRKSLGLSTTQFGEFVLGYKGEHVSVQVRGLEAGTRPISPTIARLLAFIDRHGVAPEWLEP